MWNDDVEWWLETFDLRSEDLLAEAKLADLTEAAIRDHFLIPESVDPIDGVRIEASDLVWLRQYVTDKQLPDLAKSSAFLAVHPREVT